MNVRDRWYHAKRRVRELVEDEWFDRTQESENRCIHQTPALLVTHRGLELVYPDTRVYGHSLALHCLQPGTRNE